jgi:hypothetical protein
MSWHEDSKLIKARNVVRSSDSMLEQTPVYFFYDDQVGLEFPPRAVAWTSWDLDARLESDIRARGTWEGKGFAAVFKRCAHQGFLIELAIHEAAHFVDSFAATSRDGASTLESAPWNHAGWHGKSFIRSIIHLEHRCRRNSRFVHADTFAGDMYGLSEREEYRVALGDEPERLLSKPLPMVLNMPAPAQFDSLFDRDVAAWQRAPDVKRVHRARGLDPGSATRDGAFANCCVCFCRELVVH